MEVWYECLVCVIVAIMGLIGGFLGGVAMGMSAQLRISGVEYNITQLRNALSGAKGVAVKADEAQEWQDLVVEAMGVFQGLKQGQDIKAALAPIVARHPKLASKLLKNL